METQQDFYTHLRALVAKDDLPGALRQLQNLLQGSPNLNEALLQSARLSDISRQIRLGMVDATHANLTKNQIRMGILELLDEIEAQEKALPAVSGEVERFAAGTTIIQNAEKIYNIEKIDQADFSDHAYETTISANRNVVIQGISDSTLTLNVDGEVREINNQLAELKSLLQKLNVQNVQYADKIYNIEHIDEANFGFVTGKKAFNELLTKQLIEAIRPHSLTARRFLEKVAAIPDWENQLDISDKAKEIIAYSFVGVIGIQLRKLMAIGKEDFSEAKQRKYIEKCIQIAKRSLDLLHFALLSKWWDAQKQQPRQISDTQRKVLTHRFDGAFEPSVDEQFRLLQVLVEIFSNKANTLTFPIPELEGFTLNLQEGSEFHQTCQHLQALNKKLDKSQYDLLDCFRAETELAAFFQYFHFLVNYYMASIKHIGYRHIRNADARYLHRYAAIGIDSDANVDAEKINYTPQTVDTDSVLLYRGDNYQENINLFPFVIDYNALTLEQGSKICFYHSKEISDGSLEYLFLEDNSTIDIDRKGLLKPDSDFNELMMSKDNQIILNLDSVVEQFHEARRCLLGDEPNFNDL